LFMFIAMAAVALTGCNKDDNGEKAVEEDEIQFYLKITQENDGTKADAGQVADGTTVNFTEGAIFFADAADNFVRFVRITNNLVTGTVSAAELEKGYLFNGISNIATRVYVVGGYDFSGHTSIANKAVLDAITVNLQEQSDATFGVSNASLIGSGAIVPVGTGSIDPSVPGFNSGDYANATHEAYIEVSPLIARWEIESVGTKTGADIDDGWILEGIYIDNFYYTSTLFASYSNWNEYAWGAKGDTYNKYDRLNNSSNYSTPAWNPILFDDGSYDYSTQTVDPNRTQLATAASGKVSPDNGAWAYNIFADAGNVPNIVLHISNVKSTSTGNLRPNQTMDDLVGEPGFTHSTGDYDGVAFLTVTGYNQNGSPVTIEGGHIYVISNLLFDEDDLRDEPKGPEDPDDPDPSKKFDVFVQVKLMEWKAVPVEVEFN
ncbi:MAG: hypothetical protein LUG98_09535, partial [Tannerellaceae bacterium]|nr:hypothetical protein [Tannerellaceae bacterium]